MIKITFANCKKKCDGYHNDTTTNTPNKITQKCPNGVIQ